MNNSKVWRWTGVFGLAAVAMGLAQFPLYSTGIAPSVYDGAAFGQYLFTIQNVVFTRILLDMGLYVAFMVFGAGFSHLIRRAQPEYDWVATLVFGALIVWVGVTLIANGLEGAAVLDTLGGKADPSAVRGLIEGTLLIYNGAMAFVITGLFLGAAGYATFATGVLPRGPVGWRISVLRYAPYLFRRCMEDRSTPQGSTTLADWYLHSLAIFRVQSGSWWPASR